MTDCQETKPSPKKVASLRLPPFDDDDGDDGDSSHKAKRARKVKEALIDHTYRDYSRVEVTATDEDYEDEEGEDQRHDQRRKEPPRASSNFPAKLHAILSNPSYQHIIRWMVSNNIQQLRHFFPVNVICLVSLHTTRPILSPLRAI